MKLPQQQQHATYMRSNSFTVAHLKAAANSMLPRAGAPKEMQRTSAVGHCTASQEAARVDTVPAPQKPTLVMRLGCVSPAVHTCAVAQAFVL